MNRRGQEGHWEKTLSETFSREQTLLASWLPPQKRDGCIFGPEMQKMGHGCEEPRFLRCLFKKGRLSTPKKNAKHRRQSRTCVPNVWRPTLPPQQQQLSRCPVSRATPYTKATAHRWTAKTRERHWEKTLSPTLSQPFHPEKRKTYTGRGEKGQLVDMSYQSRSIAISRPTSSCTFHVVGKKICIGTASS